MRVAVESMSLLKIKTESVNELKAYSHYIIMKAQLAGCLNEDGHIATPQESDIAGVCRTLSSRIYKQLSVCRENHIPELLECYNIIYRIGYKRLPDLNFIDRCSAQVFNAWKNGNREIDESIIFGIVYPLVEYMPEKAPIDYLEAFKSLKNKWLTTLQLHYYFPDATKAENYRRLAIIMRLDLYKDTQAVSEADKRRWCDRNQLSDFSGIGTNILRSYRSFISSLYPGFMEFDEQLALDNRILLELSSRPELHPHDSQAFALALRFNNEHLPQR